MIRRGTQVRMRRAPARQPQWLFGPGSRTLRSVNDYKNQTFPRRLGFALAGLAVAWRSERSFRLQLFALATVLLVLLALRVELLWWALVTITSAAVIGAELFNTALE